MANSKKKSHKREKQDYAHKHSDQQNGNDTGAKRYNVIEYTALNSAQNFLYNRVLFGLSIYPPEEIKEMHWEKKKRIMKVYKRAQTVLNVWKQEIVGVVSTNLFVKYFPKTEFTKFMVATTADTDSEYVNKLSFKTLGITRKMVIDKLIEEKILPVDFYKLKPDEKCK